MNEHALEDGLRGFTILTELEFSVNLNDGHCTLVLELAKDTEGGSEAVRAEFFGVSNLTLRNFGGGVTQLLHLVIENISDRQLDRITYHVREEEEESLSFLCQRIELINPAQF